MTNAAQGPARPNSVTMVEKAEKEDTKALVTTASDANPEDPFSQFYEIQKGEMAVTILKPPFPPAQLFNLIFLNNTLAQCVDIMRVNIDGTGHTIEKFDPTDETEDEAEKKMLENFFDEPYPGKSMISIRTDVRTDLESTGNGYLEMIRAANDDLVLMDRLKSADMRLVRLDEPVFVEKIITRKGKELTVKIRARERRFVQLINGNKTYFKAFGASRDLDRKTGKWSKSRLPADQRASEVIHFTVVEDAVTAYGVPRWINQMPSVLGSRKAEEFNLEFFDSGGLPPVLVVVQGGYLGEGVKDSLQQHLGGKGNKHRAAIVEAISSSGSLDSSGSVKVTVERFGTERQQDSMFQQYDKNAEEHVRSAFRLPPLFMGKAADFNFATAMTGYMTAEAQVFAPERLEFDEMMWWVCKALGAKKYTYKSKPMNLTNIEVQLKAIQVLVDKGIVEPEDVVKHLNAALGMTLTFKDPPPPPPQLGGPQLDAEGKPIAGTEGQGLGATPQVPGKAAPKPANAATEPGKDTTKVTSQSATATGAKAPAAGVVKKAEDTIELIDLCDRYAATVGLTGPIVVDPDTVRAVKTEVDALDAEDRKVLNHLLATRSLVEVAAGAVGLQELCGIATTMSM